VTRPGRCRRGRAARIALGAALLLVGVACRPGPQPPLVAAAASLRRVMPDLVLAYGAPVSVTYGGSGTLRQQILGGAPIDAVVFAAAGPVDELVGAGLADPDTRVRVATNELVLVGRPEAGALRWATLGELPDGAWLAIGDPSFVPAGAYAEETLRAQHQWDALADNLLLVPDVGVALAHARRGEVVAAAVYATDARGTDEVQVLDRARGLGGADPEVVAAAITRTEAARAFVRFLSTPPAAEVFARHGFGPR
jgi:molybdate transport system substrate-binding protein